MSAPEMQIGHVLAVDIVGYSKLLIHEQSELLQRLNAIVRGTAQFQAADSDGQLLRLPVGDGMVLVFFNDPKAPIECATEISLALKKHPDIHLRMGIHSGPVQRVSDVNDRTNVAGAGIDMAQRVMDCGDAGHILLSKRVADDLAPYLHWHSHLHELGDCEVKHGRKIFLVNFYTGEVGNPEPPAKCGALKILPAVHDETPPPAARRVWMITAGALVALLVAAFAVFLFRRQSNPQPVRPVSPVVNATSKSIAVLPFENLSHDPDNAYFADGIQEEILTRLSRIGELKVISRTSTQRYKSAPPNLSEIAKQLGVAHVLEGSVQRSADQVRVNVQLIDARNDSHIWADNYDRKLTDIFAVETEIATKIADTLKAKLSGGEQRALASRPTQNSEAHELYLKGRYFMAKRTGNNLNTAINYFNQAVIKDPNYALAYAGLADSYVLLPEYSNALTAECFPKARQAAKQALAIDPNLAEAHTSLALLLASDDMNFDAAKREYEQAIQLDPNQAQAHYFLSVTVLAPLGEFDRAVSEIKRALELDPLSVIAQSNLAYCHFVSRRYPEAITEARKAIELDPNFPFCHGVLAQALEKNGETAEAIQELMKSYQIRGAPQPLASMIYIYGLHGERARALELVDKLKEFEQGRRLPAYHHALVGIGLGENQQAIDWLEQSYRAKESGVIIYIKVDPMLDPLRGDPRFEKLANQVVRAVAK